MLIILEGANGSGKTTLANLLKETLNATVVHCTADTPNNLEFFKKIVEASDEQIIIADRFCYGQFVYQEENERPMGNYEETSYQVLYNLETYMLNYNVKLIYVWADPYEIIDRLKRRGEDTSEVIHEAEKYEELWKHTLLRPIYFKT